jgi:hypothetical protein
MMKIHELYRSLWLWSFLVFFFVDSVLACPKADGLLQGLCSALLPSWPYAREGGPDVRHGRM